jgi:hypothetical protein
MSSNGKSAPSPPSALTLSRRFFILSSPYRHVHRVTSRYVVLPQGTMTFDPVRSGYAVWNEGVRSGSFGTLFLPPLHSYISPSNSGCRTRRAMYVFFLPDTQTLVQQNHRPESAISHSTFSTLPVKPDSQVPSFTSGLHGDHPKTGTSPKLPLLQDSFAPLLASLASSR